MEILNDLSDLNLSDIGEVFDEIKDILKPKHPVHMCLNLTYHVLKKSLIFLYS